MQIIEINGKNIDAEHICCALGNDKVNKQHAETKKQWMKERFADGLVFKRLNERGKVFIEYMPAENAWKPIIADNYMAINCLWVSGQFKGQGWSVKLLDECLKDARDKKMNGVVVVSSNRVKPFLTDKKFYEKNGFAVTDTAQPYFELLTFKFNKEAPDPKFADAAKTGKCRIAEGMVFVYCNQCPFMESYVAFLADLASKRGIKIDIRKLQSPSEAREIGSPFGTLGIYYNGEFAAHDLMPEKKFNGFLDELGL